MNPKHLTTSIVVAAILMSALAVPAAAASPAVSAQGDSGQPGETVTVSVTLEQGQSIKLSNVPTGWTVADHQDDGAATFQNNVSDKGFVGWLWFGGDQDKRTVSVTFELPSDATSRTVALDAKVEDSDGNTATTTAEVSVDGGGGTGFLSGRVADQNNEAVANALVSAVQDGTVVAETYTDAAGEYTLDLPTGTYNLTAQKEGFSTARATGLVVESDRTTTANLVMQGLVAPASIDVTPGSDSAPVGETIDFTVTVTDKNGEVLPDTTVEATTANANLAFVTSQTLTTNATGEATFTVTANTTVSSGEISVTAVGGENPTTTATVEFTEGNQATPAVTAHGDSGTPGETVTVNVTAEQAMFAQLSDIPLDWTVTAHQDGNALFSGKSGNDTTVGWLWLNGDQDKRTVSVTFELPSDATSQTLDAKVEDSDGNTVTTTADVAVGTDDTTTVSLQPGSQSVAPTQTTTYDVVVDQVDNGVGAYAFNVSLDNTAVGEITDVSLNGGVSPGDALTIVDYADDGSWVRVGVPAADVSGDVVASVTVQPVGTGVASLSLDVNQLADRDGNEYTVSGTTGATLEVVENTNPAKKYDMDGDGEVDTSELQTAIDDWAAGADGALTTQEVQTLIDIWAQGGNYDDFPV